MPKLAPIAPDLLAWFCANKRVLPFRQNPTPYGVWVSEIMLQQTRVSAAMEHYERFMRELPTVQDLATCEEEKLFKLWEGLGYYSRARNLKKAAIAICEQHGGTLPADYNALLKLPGIGAYTAGAIGSIAFGLPVPAVDGNVLRVFSRLYNDDRNISAPATKAAFTTLVMQHQPPETSGAYNEALMELGALVCLPNGVPLCGDCPLRNICRAKQAGTQETLPVKDTAKARRIEEKTVFLLRNQSGAWLLEQRPESGLLAGLYQPVLLEGHFASPAEAEAALAKNGILAKIDTPLLKAKHIFSHIEWQMQGWQGTVASEAEGRRVFAAPQEVYGRYALPNAFKAYKKLLCE